MKSAFTLACIVLVLACSSTQAVLVTPDNMNGWTSYATDSSGTLGTGTGTATFVTGPATPPAGIGSANLKNGAGAGDGSVQFRYLGAAGTRLDSLTALSYSTYATDWNGQQLPYLTIWLDFDGNGTQDDRLQFEPTYSLAPTASPEQQFTWQTWDAFNSKWYSDNEGSDSLAGVFTFASYVTAHPDATIIDAAPGIGGIRLTSGFTSASDNFDTNIDNFTISSTSLGSLNFDFEPAAVPEPSAFLFGGLVAGVIGCAAGGRRLVSKLRKQPTV